MNNRERIIKAIAVSKSQQEISSSHFEPDLSGEKSVTNNNDFSVVPLLRNDSKDEINSLSIGIKISRDEIKKRITTRLKKRLMKKE